MRVKTFLFSAMFALFVFMPSRVLMAADDPGDNSGNIKEKISLGGYSFWQVGQIVKGVDRQYGEINHQWQNNVLIGLTIKARPSERLSLIMNPEFFLNYPYPQINTNKNSKYPLGVAYINEACGTYSFGDMENPLLQASLGMFDFKYNHEGTNFGDYLFRTGTYPTYIINNFDFPAARLLGLHINSDCIKNFHADLLFTSEAFIFPLWDFSLTGIVSYKFFNAIEIGAGVDFARCLPVSDSTTSPKIGINQNPTAYNSYITQSGDTAYYSFKATKVMTRATIDPKPFFGSPKLFGPDDLKLYGEICWVGVEGYNDTWSPDSLYRPWYHNLDERTPRMVGFNFPAFRILDVLSCEVEYFPIAIPNDYSTILESSSPMPYIKGGYSGYQKAQGALRWSVYAKKMVVQGFSVIGEVAFDHMRTTILDGTTQFYEATSRPGDWHWMLKFGYSF
jgi:hypothetical protein